MLGVKGCMGAVPSAEVQGTDPPLGGLGGQSLPEAGVISAFCVMVKAFTFIPK